MTSNMDKNVSGGLMGRKGRYSGLKKDLEIKKKMATICIAKPYEKVFSERELRKCGYWKEAHGRKKNSLPCSKAKQKMAVDTGRGMCDICRKGMFSWNEVMDWGWGHGGGLDYWLLHLAVCWSHLASWK